MFSNCSSVTRLLLPVACACLIGCGTSKPSSPSKPANAEPIVWLEEGLDCEGAKVSVGYRGSKPKGGASLEPVVSITRDGSPVADAMVFDRLVSADGQTTHGAEAATVYEPAADGKSGNYEQGKLQLPENADGLALRVRVVLPESETDWQKDVPLSAK
jgi:hypothetical protein